MTGMLAALYLALNLVGFRAWSFHVTFASLPVVVGALLFGPVEGMLIAPLPHCPWWWGRCCLALWREC